MDDFCYKNPAVPPVLAQFPNLMHHCHWQEKEADTNHSQMLNERSECPLKYEYAFCLPEIPGAFQLDKHGLLGLFYPVFLVGLEINMLPCQGSQSQFCK